MQNITGIYRSDDDGLYYVRVVGDILWWLGFSNDGDLQHGLTFSNVFLG